MVNRDIITSSFHLKRMDADVSLSSSIYLMEVELIVDINQSTLVK